MPPSKSSATNPNVQPDPRYPGSTIRKVFFIEAIANLFTIPLITHPRTILPILLANSAQVDTALVLFARFFGIIIVGGLTTGLLFGATNTRNGVESRRPVYLMLGAGEGFLLPILISEVVKNRKGGAALNKITALGFIACLVSPLCWRLYVLFLRPELLGKYEERKERDGAGGIRTKCK
jgi:hypothetical protein